MRAYLNLCNIYIYIYIYIYISLRFTVLYSYNLVSIILTAIFVLLDQHKPQIWPSLFSGRFWMINSLLSAIDKYVGQHFTQIICYKAYARIQLPKVISCVEEARWHFPWCFASQQWMPLHSSWQSDWNLTSDTERKVRRHEAKLLLMNWNRTLVEKEEKMERKRKEKNKVEEEEVKGNLGRMNKETLRPSRITILYAGRKKKKERKERKRKWKWWKMEKKMVSNNIDNSSLKKDADFFSLFIISFSFIPYLKHCKQ